MSTASTKPTGKQQPVSEKFWSQSPPGETPPPEASGGVEASERFWIVASVCILLLAMALRFYDLDLVPLHHDEGVNGNFLVRLVREGFYQYDPANYHGPTLYYFAALFPRLLRMLFGAQTQNRVGLTTEAIRFVPALFGVATVWLILTLRRNLGTIASLSAAALLAVSPGAVYLSRYFIHESIFTFFTLALVVAGLKYFEQANPTYLLLASLSASFLFATKETAIISVLVLILALLLTYLYQALRSPSTDSSNTLKRKKKRSDSGAHEPSFVERAGGPSNLALWMLAALSVFIAVNVLLYSSFFANFPKGVWDAIKTFEFWQKTGKEAHVHPFSTYIWWLLLQEAPLLLLGTIGAILTVLKPTRAFALFSALWAFGLIAAYSLIAYKTPWLALNFIVPLALCSGYTIERISQELKRLEVGNSLRALALAFVVFLVMGFVPGLMWAYTQDLSQWKTFIPGYQTFDLNFRNYDNDDPYYVYVYAHTRRGLIKMIEEVNRVAEETHQGNQTGITIVSADYWPLPWYFRDFTRVGYFGHMSQSTEPIIIASQGQAEEVEATFGARYQQVQSGINPAGTFPLRPGVELMLFTRRELVK